MRHAYPKPVRLVLPLFLTLSVASLPGCDAGHPPTYPVKGKVVFPDGSPMPGGIIMFQSVSEGDAAVNATGTVQEDGTFQITTFVPNDGAVAGVHQIIVREAAPDIDFQSQAAAAGVIDPRFSRFDTSGLQVTVRQPRNDLTIQVQRPAPRRR